MGFVIVLIIVLVFAVFIFIDVKISNFKYRAKQQALKNTGISSSEINAGINSELEKKQIEKFLNDYPAFTEESIKELFKEYTVAIISKASRSEFSDCVNEKIINDRKLDKMQEMKYVRSNINFYSNDKLSAVVVYTDERDEYNIYFKCSMTDGKVKLDKYNISKGAVIGF